MVDIGMPLMMLFLSVTMVMAELPVSGGRGIVGGALLLVALAILAFSLASLTTDFTIRAPVPGIVPKLILLASLALVAVKIALYVRSDARRLRQKKAAQP